MYKTRTKLVVEAHGGMCYGWHKDEMDCNTQECPSKFECIDILSMAWKNYCYTIKIFKDHSRMVFFWQLFH